MPPDVIRAEPAPQPAAPDPARLGRYRLLKKLASGGMAHVYLAAADGPEGFTKPLVVKTILPEYSTLADITEMFVVEAKIAALFNHPNIVQVYDFGKAGERYYLAMEWVEGPSLDGLLKTAARRGRPLGPRAALEVGQAMCEALSALEAAATLEGTRLELVHRDLTPGNILLARSGAAKLTDFGVVKTAQMSAAACGAFKGKFAYMAPEQAQGQEVDARADLYSLAVVLFEMVTGRSLFKRETVEQTLAAVASGNVPLPRGLAPELPESFERILLKALARDRAQRYPAAAAMLADLEAVRLEQRWPGCCRELARLVDELCPADPEAERALREALKAGCGSVTRPPGKRSP